jgi:hypothetical protein
MKKCESDDDCRASEGYRCLPPPVEVNAVILEGGENATASVCMVELKVPMSEPKTEEPGICSAPTPRPPIRDAAPDVPPIDARPADAGANDASRADASGGGASPDAGVRDAQVGQ